MQQQIVDVVRRLEDAGEITTHSDEQEEQFVSWRLIGTDSNEQPHR